MSTMSNHVITNCTNANILNVSENRGTLPNNISDIRGTLQSNIGNDDDKDTFTEGSRSTLPSSVADSRCGNTSYHHNQENYTHNNHSNQDSDNEYTEHFYKKEIGLVLCCTDHSFINKTFEFLKDHPTSTFNYIILSGASLGYNTGTECWKNTFLDHVDLAIKTNHINKIIVIDHDNCTSYKSHYNDLQKDPDLEDEYHYINMLKFKKEIKKFYPELTVFTHLLK